jgi:hypothetical protein
MPTTTKPVFHRCRNRDLKTIHNSLNRIDGIYRCSVCASVWRVEYDPNITPKVVKKIYRDEADLTHAFDIKSKRDPKKRGAK